MAMETQDIIKRSATNPITPAPRARDYKVEVAKLIDVSSCVGCKACQVACSEWNDLLIPLLRWISSANSSCL